MFYSLKKFWFVLAFLVWGTQSMFGYSLIGPLVNDTWQVNTIGYFLGGDIGGPKNIGEGYRWNTPTIYYAYDANFVDYFGSNGLAAVDAAFGVFNSLSNVDSYSSGLTEWPQTSIRNNFTASALNLLDLKSYTMQVLMELTGFAMPTRWVYGLHDRFLPGGAVCPSYEYLVIERNYDPVSQVYSQYVNGTLYGFTIVEECPFTPDPIAPVEADADEYPADPAAYASGETFAVADYLLGTGQYYTSLTQDDLGGLRYLYSSNRINTEVVEPNTQEFFTNTSNPQLLVTSNLTLLVQASLTNDSNALLALFPGLVINSSTNFFSNVVTTNITATFYYPPNQPAGTFLVTFITNFTTNAEVLFAYNFANVVTNHYYTNSYVTTSVTNITAPPRAPAGTLVTNVVNSTVFTPFVTGDYYIIPTNLCGPYEINSLLLVSVATVTNTIGTNGVNVTGGITNGQSTAFNVITYFTNYSYSVYPVQCDTNNAVEAREGVEKLNFVRVDFDSLVSGIWGPVTNYYTLTQVTNSAPLVQSYRRIVLQPDILISAQDLATGPDALPVDPTLGRTNNYNSSQALTNLSGPGTLQPSTIIDYNKVGPVYDAESPSFLTDTAPLDYLWASFDGTTNAPVIYPSSVSLSNLLSEIFFQITNSVLPDASVSTNKAPNPYSYQLQAVGGTPPYTWSLPPNTPALPTGLNLSSNGVVSGSPTTTGIYDFVVQATDFGARTNQRELTIQVDP